MNKPSAPRAFQMPWRYGLFLLLCLSIAPLVLVLHWREAVMAGFDIAAIGFFVTMPSLFSHDAHSMRRHARENDANRHLILLVTALVMLAILVAVATELTQKDARSLSGIILILVTLALTWLFTNMVYALHYAHLYYLGDGGDGESGDRGGLEVPGTATPDYWDFVYFAFTLGMTFQTSDIAMPGAHMRKVAIFHCLAAFVFNLGILAFSINVLGGG